MKERERERKKERKRRRERTSRWLGIVKKYRRFNNTVAKIIE